ncbi:hypothetical protein SAMN05518871_109117 [Psychrobacillus sp. OK028]|nr:hypothetical protein SAMN05518871_109117 [Psychrobacillus sp. OK028]
MMVLMLTACTGVTKSDDHTKEEALEAEATSPDSTVADAIETRPAVENFELLTSEGNHSLEAALQHGKGYSLYVFENFTFDAAKGRLSMSNNLGYYVDIEVLPSDYDLEQLEIIGEEELSQFGVMQNYSGELVEHPLVFADLYLQVSGEEGISDYIVWKSEAGDAFLFRLHNPKGEEASDFAGPVLISLSTVQSES